MRKLSEIQTIKYKAITNPWLIKNWKYSRYVRDENTYAYCEKKDSLAWIANGITHCIKIAYVIARVMADNQKLKPNPDGLNFHEAVGNPGHSNMYIIKWQSNYLIFFI